MSISRVISLTIAVSFILAFMPMLSHAKDKTAGKIVPAAPKNRNAPTYPLKCISDGHDTSKPIAVTLTFNVDKSGKTNDIRIVSSANDCFNEGAVNVASTWIYEPRTVNGRKQKQYDLETTIRFVVDKDEEAPKSEIQDFDAQPLKRMPPKYPEKCQQKAKHKEFVVLEFDVNETGNTLNPRVILSSSPCFEKNALKSVKKWTYTPRTINGVPTVRPNVLTRVTFQLAPSRLSDIEIRKHILRRASRISRLMKKSKMDEAYAGIKEMLADESLNLSPAERALILQLRAGYRINQKEYAGALDDLYYVRTYGYLDEKRRKSILETIASLERALGIAAVSRSAPAQSSDETTDKKKDKDEAEENPSQ